MKISGRQVNKKFLEGAPMEIISCWLCSRNEFEIIAKKDCVGVPVNTVLCRSCALIFLNPRPTADWYRQFYSSLGGSHHEYSASAHTGEEKPIGAGFEAAKAHGRALSGRLGAYLKPGLTIDVGSSEGGVLAGMKEVLGIEPLGIEPVPAEAEYASARGIPTHTALIEDIAALGIKLPPAANIVCVKSLNHFLDPAHFFRWAWETLMPDGRLLVEVKNFRHQVRRTGRIESGIQLDHPYMYVPETLRAFIERAGFEVLSAETDEGKPAQVLRAQVRSGLPGGHIRIAARKTERRPFYEAFVPRPNIARKVRRSLLTWNLYFYYLLNYANIRKNLLTRIGL